MLSLRPISAIVAAAVSASAGVAVRALPAAAEVPQVLAAAGPSEKADFDLYFPIRDRAKLAALVEAQSRAGAPEYHKWLTPQQFDVRFGPTAATVAKVTAELAARGLAVTAHQGLMLHVAGTAAAVQSAFGVRLVHGRFTDGSQAIVADRALTLPPALAAAGVRTPQFSTAPPLRKDSQFLAARPNNFSGSTGPYLADDLRQAYDYPAATAVTARGVSIGILMNGDFTASDLAAYFSADLLPQSLWPTVTSIPINGGLPFSTQNSGETELDIEQSGAMSLGANIHLYNLSDLAPSTIIFGLNHIVTDNVADVVNMSFGGPEAALTAANNRGIAQFYLLNIEDDLFFQGTSQGITFVASSGDHGAIPLAGPAQKPTLTVNDPASDPFVVAVGGTNLVTQHIAGSNASAYVSENAGFDQERNAEVWASGGGISMYWDKPSYQSLVPTQSPNLRTVPDLALHMGGCPSDAVACHTPNSSDFLVLGGKVFEAMGTSASAPDIAALLALEIALTRQRLGWENIDIYTRAHLQNAGSGTPFHHKGIAGNNGFYSTAVPYDLVIGNGSVDGRQFLGATKLPASGVPGTATNP